MLRGGRMPRTFFGFTRYWSAEMADAGYCRITGQPLVAPAAAPVLCSVSCHAHDNVMTLQCNEGHMCHICGRSIYRPLTQGLEQAETRGTAAYAGISASASPRIGFLCPSGVANGR